MIQEVIIATHNPHKVEEMRQLLACTGWTLHGANNLESPIEDGGTFEANALIKARAAAAATGKWALADDSGLCVDALNGLPGVGTAYYGGWPKLLENMKNKPREGRFICVLALVGPHDETYIFSGTCEGAIAYKGCGEGTFGYDPVFIPKGETRTFAEMRADEKHAFSHRGAAVHALLTWWAHLCKESPSNP